MRAFETDEGAQRVLFGSGTLSRLPAEVDRLGARPRVVVVSTAGRADLAERAVGLLGDRVVLSLAEAVMHTPVEVTDRAERRSREAGADTVVSLGGGSATGLGKALSARLGVRHLAVPTTYSGSESTPVLGESADGVKTTRSAPQILPEAVLYDVELTASLPPATALTSAVNAAAHAVEALYGPGRTENTDALALESLTATGAALGSGRHDEDARADLLYAAWLAGRCLAQVGMGLHHKLCHTLGGSFALPHAETHTVVLPYAMEHNRAGAPQAVAAAERALGVRRDGLQGLVRAAGGPTDLAGLGLRAQDVDRAAELATARPYPNPREVTREAVKDLLARATAGEPTGGHR